MKKIFYIFIFFLFCLNSKSQSVNYEKILKGHDRIITCFDIDQNEKYIISGSFGGDIIIWNYKEGTQLKKIPGLDANVSSISISPDSKYFAVGFSSNNKNAIGVTDNCLKIFSLNTFNLIKNLSIYPDRYEKLGLIPELNYMTPNGIKRVVFSNDGNKLAAITLNGDVFIWDIVNEFKQVEFFFRKHNQIAWEISPDLKYVIYTNESLRNEVDSCFYLKEIKSDKTLVQFDSPKATFFEAYFSKSLKFIVTVSGKRATQNEYNIWDFQTHKLLIKLQGNTKMMWKPTFDENENYIVGAGEYGKVNLWDIHTGNLLLSFHENNVNDYPYILFSPDQKYLIYNSEDETIKYWKIESWIKKQ
jgi:WD40 repeat protein